LLVEVVVLEETIQKEEEVVVLVDTVLLFRVQVVTLVLFQFLLQHILLQLVVEAQDRLMAQEVEVQHFLQLHQQEVVEALKILQVLLQEDLVVEQDQHQPTDLILVQVIHLL
jgi:hypothetical protein